MSKITPREVAGLALGAKWVGSGGQGPTGPQLELMGRRQGSVRGAGRQRLQEAGDGGHRTLAGRSAQSPLGACPPHPRDALRVSPDPTPTLPAAAQSPGEGFPEKAGT